MFHEANMLGYHSIVYGSNAIQRVYFNSLGPSQASTYHVCSRYRVCSKYWSDHTSLIATYVRQLILLPENGNNNFIIT